MTGVYENFGLRFQFPENWKLAEESADDSIEINLESPTGAVWSLNLFSEIADAPQVAERLNEAMQAEFPDVESLPASETVAGLETVGYDLSFFYLDFLVTAQIRCVEVDGRTFAIMTEAESREFDALEEVFRAITVSLLMDHVETVD